MKPRFFLFFSDSGKVRRFAIAWCAIAAALVVLVNCVF